MTRPVPRDNRALARIALSVGLALLLLTVSAISAATLLAKASERSVTYRFFDEALSDLPETPSAVVWDAPARRLGRPLTDADRDQLGRTMTMGWQALASTLATGVTTYLPDHFSGVALERSELAAQDRDARMVVLHSRLSPVYHHRDGSIVQLRSEALTVRFLLDDAGQLDEFRLTQDQTLTLLMKETKGWRLFGHVRNAVKALPPIAPAAPKPGLLVGINYYPSASPWIRFWPDFDADIVARDLSTIKGMGATSIRIFLQRAPFLDPATRGKAVGDLITLLQLAADRDLTVIPTLFDMKPSYEPATWATDVLYLQTVLPPLAAAPNVAFVDLKNEPDIDFERAGSGTVEAWLRTMLGAAQLIAPDLPYTVGWARAASAPVMSDALNVISYHDYQDIDGSRDRLAAVRLIAAGKPVYVTEIGSSSWSGLPMALPGSNTAQATEVENRLTALRGADGVFVWTLHDFPQVDVKAVGRSPWVKRLQSNFGLIAADGTEKPIAAVLRRAKTLLMETTP
ncbi:MAG: hypothetical protein V4804_18115 [Pseudomonadota bacterium]